MILNRFADYSLAMGGQNITLRAANRITEFVVLLMIAVLVARTAEKDVLLFAEQASLRFHHVHHELFSDDKHKDVEHDATDPTSAPHHHSDDDDGKEQHQHCHTHGIAHVVGDVLFFAHVDDKPPFATVLIENQFLPREERMFSSYSAHHFRPPIIS